MQGGPDELRAPNSKHPITLRSLNRTIETNCDPVWNETPAENPLLRFTWDGTAHLVLSVFDHDRWKHDDLIGRAELDLAGIVPNEPKQLWLKLVNDSHGAEEDGEAGGKVDRHASFQAQTRKAAKLGLKKLEKLTHGQSPLRPPEGKSPDRSTGFLQIEVSFLDFK